MEKHRAWLYGRQVGTGLMYSFLWGCSGQDGRVWKENRAACSCLSPLSHEWGLVNIPE